MTNIWDEVLSREEDAIQRVRIGRLRFAIQTAFALIDAGCPQAAEDYFNTADEFAKQHGIAWGAWYD